MVNGLLLYSTFIQSALQFMPLIHPHTHIHTPTAIGCHARYQPARQEQSGVRRLAQGHFRHTQGGIEPATLRLPDDCSYLLSHLAPRNRIQKQITYLRKHMCLPPRHWAEGGIPGGSLYAGVMCVRNLSEVLLPSLLMAPDGLSDGRLLRSGSSSHRVRFSGGGRLMKPVLRP